MTDDLDDPLIRRLARRLKVEPYIVVGWLAGKSLDAFMLRNSIRERRKKLYARARELRSLL